MSTSSIREPQTDVTHPYPLRDGGSVFIRIAQAHEYDALADLSEAAYEHDYDLPAGYRADIRATAERGTEHQLWVAEDASTGQLLGTVTTPADGDNMSQLGQPGELDFRLLAVAPVARGRGLGEVLTTFVCDLAVARGNDRVVLNSGPEMVGAHRLYTKLGFERVIHREQDLVTDDGVVIRPLAFARELEPSIHA
ncbi:GNAT family N-acetyltransferase [Lysinibacter cavernae]|uniref:Ribosomal protein S18 acetylase RimI-like enzyme n=1 Tax=Lysinibacter cavernae TaxID=1640652 RepID=A0A7X5R468_9MICO|nr:GNAT family N-acetyltransferase [Lysinibacter cavernae]NIH55256.1 ribosomal protein S18 acetylase RimI-like enzyme [Lysinibacter cavernae]